MKAEGWYRDPYGIHTDRWFSNGEPTHLVRDGAVESHDAPPPMPFTGPLIEADTGESAGGSDLKRADDPPAGRSYIDAALDAGAQSGIGFN